MTNRISLIIFHVNLCKIQGTILKIYPSFFSISNQMSFEASTKIKLLIFLIPAHNFTSANHLTDRGRFHMRSAALTHTFSCYVAFMLFRCLTYLYYSCSTVPGFSSLNKEAVNLPSHSL